MTWYKDEDGNTFEIPDEQPAEPKGFLDSVSSMLFPEKPKDIYLDPTTQEFTDQLPQGYQREDSFLDAYGRAGQASLYDTISGFAGAGALGLKRFDDAGSDPFSAMSTMPGIGPLAEAGKQVYDYFSPPEQGSTPPKDPYLNTAYDYLRGISSDYGQKAQEERDGGAMDTSTWAGYGTDLVASGLGKIPGVASKLIAGPIGAAAAFGLEGTGQKYNQYLNEGAADPEGSASIAGLGDMALGYILPQSGKTRLKALATIGTGTGVGVGYQSFVDEYVTSTKNKTPYDYGNAIANAKDALSKSGPDLLANIIAGRLMPSGSSVNQEALDGVTPKFEEVPLGQGSPELKRIGYNEPPPEQGLVGYDGQPQQQLSYDNPRANQGSIGYDNSQQRALEYKGYDVQQQMQNGGPIIMGGDPSAFIPPPTQPLRTPEVGQAVADSMSPTMQSLSRQLKNEGSPLADIVFLDQPSKLTPVEHIQPVDLVDPTGRSLIEPETPKKIITFEDMQRGYKKIIPESEPQDRSTPIVALSENMPRAKTDALDNTSRIIAQDIDSKFPQKMSEEAILDPYGNQLKNREAAKVAYDNKIAEIQGETRRKLDPEIVRKVDTGELPEAKAKAISRVFPLAPEMDTISFATKVKRVEELTNKLDPLTSAEMKEQTRLNSEISTYTKTKDNPITRTMQARLFDEAKARDLTPTQIKDLGETVKQVSQIPDLAVDPFIVAQNIRNYQAQITEFKNKASTKNPFLKGVDTKKHKSIIEDEIASAIDPYGDKDLLSFLSQGQEISLGDLLSLAKRRIVGKVRQVIQLYKDRPKSSFNPNNERGSVINPVEAMKAVKESIVTFLDRPRTYDEAEKIKAQAIKDGTWNPTDAKIPIKDLDSADQFFRGMMFGKEIPVVSGATGFVREYWTKGLREKKMDKTGRYEKNVELYREGLSLTGKYATELNQHLVDVVSLSRDSQARVEKYVYGVRNASVKLMKEGKRIQETPESLARSGLNQEEIRAVNGIRQFADKALSMYEDVANSLIEGSGISVEEQAVAKVKFAKVLQERRDALYVPAERSGKYTIYGNKEATGETHYSRTDSRNEAIAIAKNLKDSGFDVGDIKEFRQIAGEGNKYLPEEMKIDLMSIIKDPAAGEDKVLSSVKAHMLKFEAVPGKTIPLTEALANYSNSLAYSTAQGIIVPKQKRVMGENMSIQDPEARKAELISYQKSEIFKQHEAWLQDSWKPDGELGRNVKLLVAHHTLGFNNVRPALMNIVGGVVMTLPEIIKMPGMSALRAPKVYAQSIGSYFSDYVLSSKMQKSDPELYAALRKAELGGFITGDATSLNEQIMNRAKNKGNLTLEKVSFFAQSLGELMLRGPAFMVAYKNAPKGKDPYHYALDFVEKTQTDSRKFAAPKWARGKLRFASALKSYPHQYWANVFEDVGAMVGSKMYPDVTRAAAAKAFATRAGLGMAAGGLKAIPFMGEFLFALGAVTDEDPMRELKKKTESERTWYGVSAEDAYYSITHGPMSTLLGGTLSSSFSVDKTYDLGKDLGEIALQTIGGAPVSLLKNTYTNATETYKNTDGNLARTLLQAAPSTIRNMGTSYLDKQTGVMLDRKGRVIGDFPKDPYSQGLMAVGVEPQAVTMKKEAGKQIRELETKASGTFSNLSDRIRFLYRELGNTPEFKDRVREIANEYVQQGVPIEDVKRRFSNKAIAKLARESTMDPNKLKEKTALKSIRGEVRQINQDFEPDDPTDSFDNFE